MGTTNSKFTIVVGHIKNMAQIELKWSSRNMVYDRPVGEV